ncbi:MAG: VacJ family lipoprotein [Gammaproteobacteria bacterium]|nr:VacJ family lipoprotein [Gammaproteobacteria bacterium]
MASGSHFKKLRVMLAVAAIVALTGCASTSGYNDPRDPIEGFNRVMFEFNDALDRVLIKPLAKGYRAVMPSPVDKGITNFFSNLDDVGSAINNLLQFKLKRSASDVGRIVVNSTVGILGFIDVASNMNLEKTGEDFGQTLGVWGVGPGPYIVLPIFGPSGGRDVIGMAADWITDPVTHVNPVEVKNSLIFIRAVDKRADLLGASRVVEEAALDKYEFMRDAYIQKRESDVNDGNLMFEDEDIDFAL